MDGCSGLESVCLPPLYDSSEGSEKENVRTSLRMACQCLRGQLIVQALNQKDLLLVGAGFQPHTSEALAVFRSLESASAMVAKQLSYLS